MTDRTRKLLRRLRIAWSVAWSMVAVLLVVLWLRSYWTKDSIYRTYNNGMSHFVTSNNGVILVSISDSMPLAPFTGPTGWKLRSGGVVPVTRWGLWPSGTMCALPYFAPVLLSMALSAASTMSWRLRFSLSTLLFATAVVAVGMGLVVYAMK